MLRFVYTLIDLSEFFEGAGLDNVESSCVVMFLLFRTGVLTSRVIEFIFRL